MPARALPSIRARLTALLVAVALLWGLGVSLAVWVAVTHEVDELLDETLQSAAEVLAALLVLAPALPDAPGATAPAPTLALGQAGQEHFAWQLVGPHGVLLRSARAPAQPLLPLPLPGFADTGGGWRVYALPLAGGQRTLFVAQTREERQEAAAEVVGAAVGSALALALLSAWWLRRRVRRELQPLLGLSHALAQYEPLPPAAPLPQATRRELQPVHDAIQDLGQRLARRVANERAFSAHAAHALRTPLAGLDLQLAVAQREAPAALQPRLARAREANARLTRVVAALLALFRSGVEPRWQALDLAELLAGLPHEPLRVQVQATAALRADADLLAAALINLLDNAVRHGASTLRLQLQRVEGRQHLTLHDDGPGLPPPRRAALAQALAEQAYEGQMGLGLMLADLVVRAHGGRLRLPEVGQGFAVQLDLPLPQDRADAPQAAWAAAGRTRRSANADNAERAEGDDGAHGSDGSDGAHGVDPPAPRSAP